MPVENRREDGMYADMLGTLAVTRCAQAYMMLRLSWDCVRYVEVSWTVMSAAWGR